MPQIGLGNVLNYYGSKIRLARYYPQHAGRVVEPFAGGAGYSLATSARSVRLSDTEPRCIAAWQWFLNASPADILALPDLPNEYANVTDLGLAIGPESLIGFWLQISERWKPTLSGWARARPGSVAYWGAKRRLALAKCRHALGGDWRAIWGPYTNAWLGPDWLYFVDPPYTKAGTGYQHGSVGFDYGALADWCKWVAIRGAPIVVCEGPGASWLPFRPLVSGVLGMQGRRSSEFVWIANLPSPNPLITLMGGPK